jgi:predicted anti-sigma-YlaC factor YlaD
MLMFSCAEFLCEFGDYLDGCASPELKTCIEEHLRECKSCRVIIDSTAKTICFVTESETFTLPADQIEPLVQDVMSRIRKLNQ